MRGLRVGLQAVRPRHPLYGRAVRQLRLWGSGVRFVCCARVYAVSADPC